jgi:hypothetical protein
MTVYRALPLLAMLVAVPLHQAAAQFGGMPGMPGSGGPGMPGQGMPGAGGGFGARPQQGPPPACQQLMALRDETQKNGMAIQTANQRKAPVQVACQLFRTYIASDVKFIKALVDNAQTCGVPPDAIKQVREGHAKANEIAKQVCDAAAQGPRPTGPSLSDALGAGPVVPDSSKSGGTFDTLSGNALAR